MFYHTNTCITLDLVVAWAMKTTVAVFDKKGGNVKLTSYD
jgi:hypothetical protein